MKKMIRCSQTLTEQLSHDDKEVNKIIIMMFAGPYGGNIGRMPDADRHELEGGQSI